jgi:hypothetical protein
MCSRYEQKRDEVKIKLRDKIYVFGMVPRANICPTDLGPIILPDEDSFACRDMRWGWQVPWDKSQLINAKSEILTQLPTFKSHLNRTVCCSPMVFMRKAFCFAKPMMPLFVSPAWRMHQGSRRQLGQGTKFGSPFPAFHFNSQLDTLSPFVQKVLSNSNHHFR